MKYVCNMANTKWCKEKHKWLIKNGWGDCLHIVEHTDLDCSGKCTKTGNRTSEAKCIPVRERKAVKICPACEREVPASEIKRREDKHGKYFEHVGCTAKDGTWTERKAKKAQLAKLPLFVHTSEGERLTPEQLNGLADVVLKRDAEIHEFTACPCCNANIQPQIDEAYARGVRDGRKVKC
jgi:hypothetical protein